MAVEHYLILIFLVSIGIGWSYIMSVDKNMCRSHQVFPLMFVYLIPCIIGLSTILVCDYKVFNLPLLLVGLCLFFITTITSLAVNEICERKGNEFNSDVWFIVVTYSSILFTFGVYIDLST